MNLHRRSRTVSRGLSAALVALALLPHALQDFAVAAPPAGRTDETPIGRLFYTPERRLALERQRASNRPTERQVESRQLSFDGLVQRSSGKRTVWVNGRPLTENDDGVLRVTPRPDQPGRARLTIPNEGGHDMAVGSAVNRDTGEASSPLKNGQVRVDARR